MSELAPRTGWKPYIAPPEVAYEDEPIKRVLCLDLHWDHDDDPMPARCNREWDHDGLHRAHGHDGQQGVTWSGP